MTALAAIDVGSNAIRLAIGTVDSEKKIQVVESYRESVRIGHGVFTQGIITDDATLKLIDAFKKFKVIVNKWGVKIIRAIGTSAFREAKNWETVQRKVIEATGVKINVIPGEEEARLIYLAISAQVNLKGKVAMLIDIGGGSIEISIVEDGDVILSDSLPMGTVRLLQLLEEKKRGQEFYALVEEYANGLKRQVKKEIGKRKIELCVGSGGNIESLAELRMLLFNKARKTILRQTELCSIIQELEKNTYEERIKKFGLRPDRADVIVPAAIMLQQILAQTDVGEVIVPHVGLKEGILIDLIPEFEGKKAYLDRKQIISFAKELGQKYCFDETHGFTVSKFAVDLFDQLQKFHKMDDESRLILEIAGILHDIGQFINVNSHHKHSYYILKSVPFVGLSTSQKELVALVCRYHRRALPSEEHPEYAILGQEDKAKVLQLSSLLRIANALDCEHVARVKRLTVEQKNGNFCFSMQGKGDCLIEKWSLMQQIGFFESVFGKSVTIEN